MGLAASKLFQMLNFKQPTRVLMIGLDAAGKTCTLYKLKLGEVVMSIPTVGFNVETVEYRNLTMTIWDVGGQDKIRALWYAIAHRLGLVHTFSRSRLAATVTFNGSR